MGNVNFTLNKVTQFFAQALLDLMLHAEATARGLPTSPFKSRPRPDKDADWVKNRVMDWVESGITFPENRGGPTNACRSDLAKAMTAQIYRGLRKIAVMLDAAAATPLKTAAGVPMTDGQIEDHLRDRMDADKEMTAAKAFLKNIYDKSNGNLLYPTAADLAARRRDWFLASLRSPAAPAAAAAVASSSSATSSSATSSSATSSTAATTSSAPPPRAAPVPEQIYGPGPPMGPEPIYGPGPLLADNEYVPLPPPQVDQVYGLVVTNADAIYASCTSALVP
jgi:hypothetical protein